MPVENTDESKYTLTLLHKISDDLDAIRIEMGIARQRQLMPNAEKMSIEEFETRYAQRPDPTVSDHRFTVRRQDGIGPHPEDLPCARCGFPKRAHSA